MYGREGGGGGPPGRAAPAAALPPQPVRQSAPRPPRRPLPRPPWSHFAPRARRAPPPGRCAERRPAGALWRQAELVCKVTRRGLGVCKVTRRGPGVCKVTRRGPGVCKVTRRGPGGFRPQRAAAPRQACLEDGGSERTVGTRVGATVGRGGGEGGPGVSGFHSLPPASALRTAEGVSKPCDPRRRASDII